MVDTIDTQNYNIQKDFLNQNDYLLKGYVDPVSKSLDIEIPQNILLNQKKKTVINFTISKIKEDLHEIKITSNDPKINKILQVPCFSTKLVIFATIYAECYN